MAPICAPVLIIGRNACPYVKSALFGANNNNKRLISFNIVINIVCFGLCFGVFLANIARCPNLARLAHPVRRDL